MQASSDKRICFVVLIGAFLDTFRRRMLPRAKMLAKKNFSLLVALSFAAGTVVSFVGCYSSRSASVAGRRCCFGNRQIRNGACPTEARHGVAAE
jgi:hypothetical protein